MHYYQHNIGDYLRDTHHLSLLEHGAYRQLLDLYYLNEGNIPEETNEVCRRLHAITDEEKNAVQTVLNEFFEHTGNGWKHARCDREISAYKAKADRARDNGKLGGRPTKTKVVISGNLEETQTKANHKPLTINQELISVAKATEGDSKLPPCPHEEIIAAYHEVLPELPTVRQWNKTRQGYLRARWKEHPNLDYWRKFFSYVSESAFLTGRAEGRGGAPPFLADLEWLLRPTNFAKVIEGKYHRSD